jgi:leucyl-tRNA synthetase
MDTFVCSSWYYFRYTDPKNNKEFASKKEIRKWLPVDIYVGGAEHSVLHLLYSRFFTKVLHNLGYIDFSAKGGSASGGDEPFLKLRHQGIILGEDGYKMSKSRGNVINPDDVVKEYGADALRMFEMFMGPLEDMKPWNTKGIIGIKRFLEKVQRLKSKIPKPKSPPEMLRMSKQAGEANPNSKIQSPKIESLVHKTIKKVTEDIENFKFNTAISALMILVNEFDKQKELPVTYYQLLITLLSPFAPQTAEELWHKLGNKGSVFEEKWPEYDPKLAKDEEIELVIQVNGKVRDTVKVSPNISEEEAKKVVMESEKVKKFIEDKEIRKVVYVKGRLINVVV